jgi:putative OPT family oligopeptide transporter
VAAGAIFTIPAFLISGIWDNLQDHYLEATAIMMLGGVLGVLFVTLLRRVMVEDAELPYPESVAAGEIHKAGQAGATGAGNLLIAGLIGGVVQVAQELSLFPATWTKFVPFARGRVVLGQGGQVIPGGGGIVLASPKISPAYIGVGYIIGLQLASLNFAGGLLAWGLFVPLLLYFQGPGLEVGMLTQDPAAWLAMANNVWLYMVRPIAIGGMLMAAAWTLWKMRRSLLGGLGRSIGDLKKAAAGQQVETERTERDIPLNYVLIAMAGVAVLTFFLYQYFAHNISASLTATLVMILAGFFFAAVSGYLVGLIGSSNNPISGLTLSTVVVAAILMVALGQTGRSGVATVLAVAGVICVSSAVAGEMLQDLKVGHILGGTPWKMQVGDIVGVLIAGAVMVIPLMVLHQGDINMGGTGLGGTELPAPQASLMAMVSQGIVSGEMAWPLVITGMLMAVGFILIRVRSPMLVCVGMYLPLGTTFAIFTGGVIKWIVEKMGEKAGHNPAQKARVENAGILLAAGLIAGEALVKLVFAGFAFFEQPIPVLWADPSFLVSLVVLIGVGVLLTLRPIAKAGSPDQPAPPSVM